VDQYAEAARAGDAEAMYELLTPASRRDYGKAGIERLVKDSKSELSKHAQAVSSKTSDIDVRAEVRFVDGEIAQLSTDSEGSFRVDSAAALPARADTPEAALSELRVAIARRNYASLMRVLSRDTATKLELWLESLVAGLEDPEALSVSVDGDRATVELRGGHRIELEREEGVWKIRDFE
jgi:hypothetical protein